MFSIYQGNQIKGKSAQLSPARKYIELQSGKTPSQRMSWIWNKPYDGEVPIFELWVLHCD